MTQSKRLNPLTDHALIRAVADAERDGASWIELSPGGNEVPPDDKDALLARAHRLGEPRGYVKAIEGTFRSIRLAWLAALAFGLLGGLSASWAGLAGGGDPTRPDSADLNPLWYLQTTLGTHTIFLLLSILLTTAGLLGSSNFLSVLARTFCSKVASHVTDKDQLIAVRAAIATQFRGRRATCFASALSQTAGLGFITGTILAFIVATSFREQYNFFWKSTLLSTDQASSLIHKIASGPRAIGIPSPTLEQIASSRSGFIPTAPAPGATAQDMEHDPSTWAWMLLGALLVWGALPRTVLLLLSLGGMRLTRALARTPVSQSYAERALERERRPKPPPEPDTVGIPTPHTPVPEGADTRPFGPPALVGYEIDTPGQWPPSPLASATDLGILDGAADRARALAQIDEAQKRPRAIIAFFSRGETPAEAEKRFLADLVARAGDTVAVVLTLSESLATARSDRDAERIRSRTQLWRDAATQAGINPARIIEADLQHLTDRTTSALAKLLGKPGSADDTPLAPSGHARTDRALLHAMDDIDAWAQGKPHDQASLVKLLQTIDGRFGAEPRWRRAVRAAASGEGLGEAKQAVTDGAKALGRVMPPWMPRHPGWMTASATLATTATLGAVAIAGGPIGIAASAWPLYAAVGAAIGEATGRGADAIKPEPPRDDEAITNGARTAVLHALVLALQGEPDAHIAITLNDTLADAPEPTSVPGIRALTDHVRARASEITGGSTS